MGKRKKHAHQPAGLRGDDQGGAQVPAPDNVPAEKPADPVSADPGEPEAAGAVEHQAEDPLAAVGEPAAAVGAEAQGEGADAAEAVAEVTEEAQPVVVTPSEHQRLRPLTTHEISEVARTSAYLATAIVKSLPYDLPPGDAEIMVEFVRDNPEAPVLAMYKHLEITKRLQPCEPNDEDLLGLTVFHTVAATVLDYERKQEAKRAAEAARKPKRTWPGARAFEAPTQPFSPTNYVPRR